MRIATAALAMSTALGVSASRAADDASFVIVVAAANPTNSIHRQELARLFLKKTSRWSDGSGVIPLDQSAGSPVRRAFTRAVLSAEGMSLISAVQTFWLQQVYSGRYTPPAVKGSDAEVLAFVGSHPGAIAYVATVPTGAAVKVLKITD